MILILMTMMMTILQAKTPQGRKQGLKVEAEETMAGE
jgi:hypothetical protein